MPSLAAETEQRLKDAGLTADDPALVKIRAWNRSLPRTACTWPTCPVHGGRRPSDG